MDELISFLKKEPHLLKEIKKENLLLTKSFEIQKRISNKLNISLIKELNKKNLDFNDLVVKFRVEPKRLHENISKLNELGLVNLNFKKNSPLQMDVSLSEKGKEILTEVIEVENED